MSEHIQTQYGYFDFVSGFLLIVMAMISIGLLRTAQGKRYWGLILYGFGCGLSQWFGLYVSSISDSHYLHTVRFMLMMASLLCLFEFGRDILLPATKARAYFIGPHVLLLCILIVGIILNATKFVWVASYSIGLAGGISAGLGLLHLARTERCACRKLLPVSSIMICIHSILCGVTATQCSLDSRWPLSIYTIQIMSLLIVVIGLWSVYIQKRCEPYICLSNKMQHTYSTVLGVLVGSVLVYGYFITNYISDSENAREQSKLLQQARIAAEMIEPATLSQLTGSPDDLAKEDYKNLYSRLIHVLASNPKFKSIYLFGRRDQHVVFLMDASVPINGMPPAEPGEIYQEPSRELIECFNKGHDLFEGPLKDSWGVWMSALVPLQQSRSGQVDAVLGIDMDYHEWDHYLARCRLFSMAGTLLVILLICVLYLIYLKSAEAQWAINLSKQRLSYALEATSEGVWDWTIKTGEVYISGHWVESLGYSRDEAQNAVEFLKRIIHPEDLPRVGQSLQAYVDNETEIYTSENRIRNADGSYRYNLTRGRVVEWDRQCKPQRIVGTNVDITERKYYEDSLREHKQYLDTIFDSVQAGILIIDASTHTILKANAAAARLCGTELTAMVGKECHQYICPAARRQCPVMDLEQSLDNSVRVLVHSSGERIPILKTVKKIQLRDKTYLVECFVDISDLKKMEANLQAAKDQAETASACKSQFLANMSHEIRTPMNAILGFADLLAGEHLSEKQNEYVDIIRNSGAHLLELLNDILDFSKIEAGKLEIETIDASLGDILNRTESLMAPHAKNKGLAFQIHEETPLPAMIRTDSTRLMQCLLNLVNNAIKFTEQGHVIVHTRLIEKQTTAYIRFEVEDTGPGICREAQDKIFSSFEQADGSTTRKYGGTGLGLTISRRLAEKMGGSLSFESTAGQGSTFILEIPANVNVGEQPRLNRQALRQAEKTLSQDMLPQLHGRILVAEDVVTNQILIRTLLERYGLEVTIATDGKEVLHHITQNPYDLIFMDMHMPHINGYEATRRLRNLGIKTPIVALTAGAIRGDDKKCLDAGCDNYLCKPIEQDQLFQVLAEYLDAKPSINAHPVKTRPATAGSNESIPLDVRRLVSNGIPESMIPEIVTGFMGDCKQNIDQLTAAVAGRDYVQIRFYSHRIKGSAATIGAMPLSGTAGQIEDWSSKSVGADYQASLIRLCADYHNIEQYATQQGYLKHAVVGSA